jgi:hypothetical protein
MIDDLVRVVAVKSRKVVGGHGTGAPIRMKHGMPNCNQLALPMKQSLSQKKRERSLLRGKRRRRSSSSSKTRAQRLPKSHNAHQRKKIAP